MPDPLRPPKSASCASLSFCSMASARRFRKSERATSPIVCVLSRSSAVLDCEVKRGFGVDAPEPGFNAIDSGSLEKLLILCRAGSVRPGGNEAFEVSGCVCLGNDSRPNNCEAECKCGAYCWSPLA